VQILVMINGKVKILDDGRLSIRTAGVRSASRRRMPVWGAPDADQIKDGRQITQRGLIDRRSANDSPRLAVLAAELASGDHWS
jgi:hypothetical protein